MRPYHMKITQLMSHNFAVVLLPRQLAIYRDGYLLNSSYKSLLIIYTEKTFGEHYEFPNVSPKSMRIYVLNNNFINLLVNHIDVLAMVSVRPALANLFKKGYYLNMLHRLLLEG